MATTTLRTDMPRPPGLLQSDLMRPLLVLVIGALLVGLLWTQDYYSRIFAVVALAVISACGLNILAGITGQISLGHAGFYAVGAYTTALLSVRYGWSVLATIPIGIAICALLGLALAWPALRLKGPYLTMVTIAFGMIIHGVATDFTSITNGPEGLFPVPKIGIGDTQLGLQGTNLFLLVVVALVIYIHAALITGRYGRAMRAVRGNETAAASLGVNVVGIKALAFAVSGVFAGLAGTLYAPVNGFVNPDSFAMDLSVLMLLMVILGGRGTIWGPVAGALVLTLIDRLLASLGDVRLVIYGAILLGTLYLMPDGLVGLLARLQRRKTGAGQSQSTAAGISQGELPRVGGQALPALSLRQVSRAFGGLMAVDNVSFDVRPASVHGLVGPNGAGKTTVLNLISGVTAPSDGVVSYGGKSLGGRPMHVLARGGIGRTFQNLALFQDMTVLENVLAGLHLTASSSFVATLLRTPGMLREERMLREEAMGLLRFVGLAGEADRPAAALPQGHQRLLEIARALAVHPTLLLLDEPAAGLNGTEVDRLIDLIRRIRASNVTVLLIEHHMQLVMAVCEQITVLDFGKKICEGPPDVVRNDPQVLEAYIGKPVAATAEVQHA